MMPTFKVDATPSPRRDVSPSPNPSNPSNPPNPSNPQNPPNPPNPPRTHRHEEKSEAEEKREDTNISNRGPYATQANQMDDDTQIIPWRAQLRKTTSKLNILD